MARNIESGAPGPNTEGIKGISRNTIVLNAVALSREEILQSNGVTPREAARLGTQYADFRVQLDRIQAQQAISLWEKDASDTRISVEGETAIKRAEGGKFLSVKEYLQKDAKKHLDTANHRFGEKLVELADKIPAEGRAIQREPAVVFVARKMTGLN